jgi:mycothiol system anti-sigma-R factor
MGSAHSNHTCTSFSDRVILYLDGQLDKQQERNLLAEMKSCPSCLEKYSKEKAFRTFIRSKVSRKKVSPTLIQSIKDKIRHSSM